MSTVTTIDTFTPVDEYVPENLVDGDGVAYTAWELLDKGSFIIQVLDSYTVGSDISVRISESTPSTAKNHKWSLACSLFRPGTGTVDTDTITQQYQCGLVADLLELRTITITSSGKVDASAVAAGDFLSVTLSRIAASSDEDPEDIQVYAAAYVQDTTAGTGTGTCLGRVGNIIADVRALFNDEGGGDIANDSSIINWMNACQQEMAQAQVWRTTAYLTTVSDQASYDLLSAPSDFVALLGVRWASGNRPLSRVLSKNEWNLLTSPKQSGSQPFYYFVEDNNLEFHPTPSSGVSSGCILEYSYLPTDLGCDTDYTPQVPPAYDLVYVHYCLAEAFKQDRHAPGAAEKVSLYRGLYDRTLQDLLASAQGPVTWGACSGRLGDIISSVRMQLNRAGPTAQTLSDLEFIRYANEITAQLSREGFFAEREQYFSGIASQRTYDLTTIQSAGYTLNRVLNISYSGVGDSRAVMLDELESWSYMESLINETSSGLTTYPMFYVLDGTDLVVWPAPSTSSASGFRLRYTYLPTALSCATSGNVTPPVPPAHDYLYTAGLLAKAYRRAVDQPFAGNEAMYWESQFHIAKRDLFSAMFTVPSMRPGR